MATKKSSDPTACTDCGCSKRHHANPEAHELGTSHCTHVTDDNKYCHCPSYKMVLGEGSNPSETKVL